MLPVAERAAAQNRRCELGDILRNYGEQYRQNHALPLSHLRVMRAVERCRTAALGGHLQQCDACGFEHPAYNSCRNRHCPKCQSLAKARWLEKQRLELLPVGYFHLVFTLPHELNRLILVNKKPLINILFHAVSETLLEFAQRHLKGTLGLTAVLHTWDQTLLDHFHLHCLVPAGVLSFDRNRWVSARQDFLFPVKALSLVFRAKFLDSLKKSFDQNKLLFVGQIAPWADARSFDGLVKKLRKKPWVVYAKKPFGSPAHVLDYLGRYTHRVALSNNRICSIHNGEVTFAYRDRKNQDRRKLMTLDAEEFIRRFLLHVIPKGFMRVRHYGFLANNSKRRLSKCRQLLGLLPALPKPPQRPTHELMLALTGIDLTRCPRCRKGTLIFRIQLPIPAPQDSS
jgi:predicted Zn-ribbon and HTH transcriptional regulator